MNFLIIDTALRGALVCLYEEGRGVVAVRQNDAPYGQAEIVMPMIEAVLAEGGIEYKDLSCIGVTKGPGAFTGLRVGLAAAQSLAQVLEIPAAGICSFAALFKTYVLAQGVLPECAYAVLIETKRQDYYVRLFDGQTQGAIGAGQVLDARGVVTLLMGCAKKVIVIGDAVARFQAEFSKEFECFEIMQATAQALGALVGESGEDLAPAYLRPADVSIPKNSPV